MRPIAIIGGLIAVCLLYAGYAWLRGDAHSDPASALLPAISAPEDAGRRGWQDVVDRVSQSIAARQAALARHPDDWGRYSSLATAFASRGKLTGNYDDYSQADRLFDRAFAVAPDHVGPHRPRASFSYLMHRLDRAEADLAATDDYAVPPSGKDRAAIIGSRGDIAFYRGNYRRARELYREADETAADQINGFRSFTLFDYLGRDAEAARQFRALAGVPAASEERSFLASARGRYELRRGRYDSALESFQAADRLFPGDWRVEALLAQMAAIDGDLPTAARIFERIAEQRSSPEAMDALAAIYRYQGNRDLSSQWAARADTIWQRRLSQFPEATYAHALDHELAFGDPERALALARANWRARPYGDAGIALAWALIAKGNAAEARQRIEQVIASGWTSYDAHVAAARIYALLGQSDRSEEQRQQALALNPHAFDPQAALLWFAH